MSHAVMIQGASRGIGLELTRQLLARGEQVIASCRQPAAARALRDLAQQHVGRLQLLQLDVCDEESIAAAAEQLKPRVAGLSLLMNVAGLLHDDALKPEKKLQQVSPAALRWVFEVNAFGPLLVAKHFAPLLLHGERAVLANLSARVASIDDNRLGGWYSYRASKTAQNMFTKNLAIELGRRSKRLVVVALHPGTVDTGLSAPFQRNVPAHKLFTRSLAAMQLLEVVDSLTPGDSGSFLGYDGKVIQW